MALCLHLFVSLLKRYTVSSLYCICLSLSFRLSVPLRVSLFVSNPGIRIKTLSVSLCPCLSVGVSVRVSVTPSFLAPATGHDAHRHSALIGCNLCLHQLRGNSFHHQTAISLLFHLLSILSLSVSHPEHHFHRLPPIIIPGSVSIHTQHSHILVLASSIFFLLQ